MISFVLNAQHSSGWHNMLFDRHGNGECGITIVGEDDGKAIQYDYEISEGETQELIQFLKNSLKKPEINYD